MYGDGFERLNKSGGGLIFNEIEIIYVNVFPEYIDF
jgi:hypothetical protein